MTIEPISVSQQPVTGVSQCFHLVTIPTLTTFEYTPPFQSGVLFLIQFLLKSERCDEKHRVKGLSKLIVDWEWM